MSELPDGYPRVSSRDTKQVVQNPAAVSYPSDAPETPPVHGFETHPMSSNYRDCLELERKTASFTEVPRFSQQNSHHFGHKQHPWVNPFVRLPMQHPPMSAGHADSSGYALSYPLTNHSTARKRHRNEQFLSENAAAARYDASEEKNRQRSKRFNWSDDLHRDFVSAVFITGLNIATSGQLQEDMNAEIPQAPFKSIKHYLSKYKTEQEVIRKTQLSFASPSTNETPHNRAKAIAERDSHTRRTSDSGVEQVGIPASKQSSRDIERKDEKELIVPALTNDEANSHLGTSLGYLIGILKSLDEQLTRQRARSTSKHQSAGLAPRPTNFGISSTGMHDYTRVFFADLTTELGSDSPFFVALDVTVNEDASSPPKNDLPFSRPTKQPTQVQESCLSDCMGRIDDDHLVDEKLFDFLRTLQLPKREAEIYTSLTIFTTSTPQNIPIIKINIAKRLNL
ncbi:hypothetical protein MPSEU_000942300 [Mayamaea pseudoterrestris]|nr:hypothetical protein MPSEU_000942300 [Mayamaea pseudoterrestris]